MHLHRLLALTGVAIGIVGLFFRGLATEGEGALAALSQQSDSFPDGIPTIWGGLETWAQVTLVVLILIVVTIAVRPYLELTFQHRAAVIVSGCGVVLLAYAAIKYLDAGDSADTLQAGFRQAAGAGIPGIMAWSVSPGIGFFVLMIGTSMVALAGVLSLISPER